MQIIEVARAARDELRKPMRDWLEVEIWPRYFAFDPETKKLEELKQWRGQKF